MPPAAPSNEPADRDVASAPGRAAEQRSERGDERAPALRASDAERDAAIARLRDGAAAGRLTFEELADRVEAASQARTREELSELAADLPDVEPETRPARAAALAAPVRNSSVFGDLRREGAWTLPATSSWDTVFGDIVLDLREARVGAPEVDVTAKTIFGDVDVLVPEGVEVEVRSRVIFGDVRQQAGGVAPPGAPRVILTGWTLFGDVKVRAKRVREKLIERWRERRARRAGEPDA